VTILGEPIALRKASGGSSKGTKPTDVPAPITGKAMAIKVLGKGMIRDPDSASPDHRETKRTTVVPPLPKLDTKSVQQSSSSLSSAAKRRKVEPELEVPRPISEKRELVPRPSSERTEIGSRQNSERMETLSRQDSEKREITPVAIPKKSQGEPRSVLPHISTSQTNRYPSPATTPAITSRAVSAVPAPGPSPVSSTPADSVFTYPSGLPMLFNIVPDKQGLSFAMEVLIVSKCLDNI
jgi:hypothetical protein